MKKLLFILSLSFSSVLFAQERNGITYQALIIDPSGEFLPGADNNYSPLKNTSVCLQFHIIDSTNSYEYSEQHTVTTDNFGMVNLVIGTGSAIGGVGWENVSWSASAKSLKVDVDKTGSCSSFEELSNQPLTSVPFALYSPGSDTPGPQGDPGEQGMSAYEVWLDLGNTGTEQDFIDSLKGPEGDPGDPGADGDSAYDVWIEAGNTGTEQEFLDSLKATDGNDGDSAYDIWLSAGNTGTEQEFLDSLKATDGNDGDSAYDIWIAEGNTGTEQEFLDSLKGPKGDPGEDASSSFSNSFSSNINSNSVSKLGTVLTNGYANQISASKTGLILVSDVYYDIEGANDIGKVSIYNYDGINFSSILTSSGIEFLPLLEPNEIIRNFGSKVTISGDGTKALISHSVKNTVTNVTKVSRKYLEIDIVGKSWNLLNDLGEVFPSSSTNYKLNDDATKLFYNINDQGFAVMEIDEQNNFIQESSYDFTGIGGSSNQTARDINSDFTTVIITNSNGNGGTFGTIQSAGITFVVEKAGNNWVQKGQVLSGTKEFEGFGSGASVSEDGNTIAVVGGNSGSQNFDKTFKTSIYEYQNDNWQLKGTPIIIRFDPPYSERVNLLKNGNFLVIGSTLNDHVNDPKDTVYFFEYKNGDWVQVGSGIEFNGIESMQSSNGNLYVIDELNLDYNQGSYTSIYELKAKKIY